MKNITTVPFEKSLHLSHHKLKWHHYCPYNKLVQVHETAPGRLCPVAIDHTENSNQ